MKVLLFTIYGRVPSKKNSRNLFVRGGKLFNIPSKRYKEWHEEASAQLVPHLLQRPLEKIKSIEVSFYAPDKRKSDLTNKTESIMDLLVDNGILEDDSWFIVGSLFIYFKGVDRENPRCEVKIWETK